LHHPMSYRSNSRAIKVAMFMTILIMIFFIFDTSNKMLSAVDDDTYLFRDNEDLFVSLG
jgi:hypothetical protein